MKFNIERFRGFLVETRDSAKEELEQDITKDLECFKELTLTDREEKIIDYFEIMVELDRTIMVMLLCEYLLKFIEEE